MSTVLNQLKMKIENAEMKRRELFSEKQLLKTRSLEVSQKTDSQKIEKLKNRLKRVSSV